MNKSDLGNFLDYIREVLHVDIQWSNEFMIENYQKFSELLAQVEAPRVNENEQAKEVCTSKHYCSYRNENNECLLKNNCEHKEVYTG